MHAKYKDGIVRRVPLTEMPGIPKTKLQIVNMIWDNTMIGPAGGSIASNKEDSAELLFVDAVSRPLPFGTA